MDGAEDIDMLFYIYFQDRDPDIKASAFVVLLSKARDIRQLRFAIDMVMCDDTYVTHESRKARYDLTALDYLVSHVPMIIDIDIHKLVKDREYKSEIANKYLKWLDIGNISINENMGMYMNANTKENDLREHFRWYIQKGAIPYDENNTNE
ncbi:MAG: hypothetical protein MZV49_13390 [Rhodopseudomonas palustris]|nr:hypothetical protein [Rhodopseudomonas palustris]